MMIFRDFESSFRAIQVGVLHCRTFVVDVVMPTHHLSWIVALFRRGFYKTSILYDAFVYAPWSKYNHMVRRHRLTFRCHALLFRN